MNKLQLERWRRWFSMVVDYDNFGGKYTSHYTKWTPSTTSSARFWKTLSYFAFYISAWQLHAKHLIRNISRQNLTSTSTDFINNNR